jgi:hypothetical protein
MRLALRHADPMRPRVVGIGLRKTGTRSVAVATRELGFRTLHKGDAATSAAVDAAAAAGRPLLSPLGDEFDVYFDVEALVHRFAEVDEQYPGSRFLLTTRPVDAWLSSMERHVLGNRERAARGAYDGGFLDVEPERWRAEFEAHHAEVRAHFADRPRDLLELDVSAGQGWERLAPFLGATVPSTPFPWENKAGEGTYRRRSLRRAVEVRARAGRQALRRVVAPRRLSPPSPTPPAAPRSS